MSDPTVPRSSCSPERTPQCLLPFVPFWVVDSYDTLKRRSKLLSHCGRCFGALGTLTLAELGIREHFGGSGWKRRLVPPLGSFDCRAKVICGIAKLRASAGQHSLPSCPGGQKNHLIMHKPDAVQVMWVVDMKLGGAPAGF